MREGRANRTAEHNALFRALETLRRPGDRLVDEPLAAALLSRDLRAVVLGARALPPVVESDESGLHLFRLNERQIAAGSRAR